jgi:LytS/YehU family sensor histidine kinase
MPPPKLIDSLPPDFPIERPDNADEAIPPPGMQGSFRPGMPPPMEIDSFERRLQPGRPIATIEAMGHKPFLLEFIDNFLIGVLIVGVGTASKLVSKWLEEEKHRTDIEKEQLKTNLALLRHQVSPHFFMNTLNNIHALIDIDTEDAKDAIIRLSTLMRYLLYDSARQLIHLKKEIEFIKSFIILMQIRYSDKVLITLVVPEQIPEIQIPPMLFISILENAFKHGVSYQSPSFIYFEIRVLENSLICNVKNSKHKTITQHYDEYSGIGLQNIRKSLDLLYNNQYQLDVLDKENDFEVNLTIPL